MTHVAEESCFRAVQLGQRLSSLPLRFVSHGIPNAGGNLAGEQTYKSPELLVKFTMRIQSGNQDACGTALSGLGNWHQDRALRGTAPFSGWQIGKPLVQVFDQNCFPALDHLPQRPNRTLVSAERNQIRRSRVVRRDSSLGNSLQRFAVGFDQINHAEGQVGRAG